MIWKAEGRRLRGRGVYIYWMAYETGCKGITVYRDRSRTKQVLVRTLEAAKELEAAPGACNRPEAYARF